MLGATAEGVYTYFCVYQHPADCVDPGYAMLKPARSDSLFRSLCAIPSLGKGMIWAHAGKGREHASKSSPPVRALNRQQRRTRTAGELFLLWPGSQFQSSDGSEKE